MKANSGMRDIFKGMRADRPLISSLQAIAEDGFVQNEGCHLLRALYSRSTNARRENFPDRTGYECFVNSVHIEDHDEKETILQAMLFVNQVFKVWNTSANNLIMTGIVSVDEFSVVTKFHVSRPTEKWLSDNIEDYGDPIMSVESYEDLISHIG